MKNSFLYRVFKMNKRLFIFFILFQLGTIVTNLYGWQATPFFVWGMYSEKEDTVNSHPVIKVTVNDSSVIDPFKYTEGNRFFLTSPLQLYIAMKKNGGEDPTEKFLQRKLKGNFSLVENTARKILNGKDEYKLFLTWYKKYLEQTTGKRVYNFTIELLHTRFTDENNREVFSKEIIDSWKD